MVGSFLQFILENKIFKELFDLSLNWLSILFFFFFFFWRLLQIFVHWSERQSLSLYSIRRWNYTIVDFKELSDSWKLLCGFSN